MSTSWSARLPRDIGVVVTAAGRGARCPGEQPKQFRPLAGAPLLLHALRPFLAHPSVAVVVVVLPAAEAAAPPAWLAELVGERLLAAAGGATRMESVEAGLAVLPAACSVVLVHDGARPFPDAGVIDAVIAQARAGSGAIAAVPVSDTLKQAAPLVAQGLPTIVRTVPRSDLWRAQTPQGFPRPLLESAFEHARAGKMTGTDEAELVELAGGTVVLVADVSTNLKVTTPDDFKLAEAMAAVRR